MKVLLDESILNHSILIDSRSSVLFLICNNQCTICLSRYHSGMKKILCCLNFLLIMAQFGCLRFEFSLPSVYLVHNPYDSFTYRNSKQLKVGLHAHSTLSDGFYNPCQLITLYEQNSFDLIAITDHDSISDYTLYDPNCVGFFQKTTTKVFILTLTVVSLARITI